MFLGEAIEHSPCRIAELITQSGRIRYAFNNGEKQIEIGGDRGDGSSMSVNWEPVHFGDESYNELMSYFSHLGQTGFLVSLRKAIEKKNRIYSLAESIRDCQDWALLKDLDELIQTAKDLRAML